MGSNNGNIEHLRQEELRELVDLEVADILATATKRLVSARTLAALASSVAMAASKQGSGPEGTSDELPAGAVEVDSGVG
ncbi:hypothetical protein IHQ71_30225 (plasmid) [Rhizobium sp. TH2]|uniref:hypothetical protein n=1 Tax=Rhizobium sp. TH2 TaxID=2775403 RepID=UPI0021581B65|nr:hypothetical protein [Rhizobium sp. TH2]UVC12517.1 hypothetical protein IHQ71_30225 [Rhizobium sp. TH2]